MLCKLLQLRRKPSSITTNITGRPSSPSPPAYSEEDKETMKKLARKEGLCLHTSCSGCQFRELAIQFDKPEVSDDSSIETATFKLLESVVAEVPSECMVMALQACIAACKSRNIPLESVFQKQPLKGRYALHHVIIHAQSDDPQKEGVRYRVIKCLLEAPLDKATRSSAYLACSARSLQGYFSLVRLAKGFQPYSANSSSLLDIESLPDEVLEVRSTGETFQVDWAIPNFGPRMRVSRMVGTEFVAQGRIWSISFSILMDGSWAFRIFGIEPSYKGGKIKGVISISSSRSCNTAFSTTFDAQPISVHPLSDKHPLKQELPKTLLRRLEGRSKCPLQFDDCAFYASDGSCHVTYKAELC